MSQLPLRAGIRVLGAATLAVAVTLTPGAAAHADGGGPFPEPQPVTEPASKAPTAQADEEPAQDGSEAPAPVSESESTPATPSPTASQLGLPDSPTPADATAVESAPASANNGSTSGPAAPVESRLAADSGSWWPWVLLALGALLALVLIFAIAMARRRTHVGSAPETAPAVATEPQAPDPWAGMSAADREAFERTAREFGWN